MTVERKLKDYFNPFEKQQLAPDADFICTLCQWTKSPKPSVQLQADYILLNLLIDRELDPIQRFCSEVIKTVDYKNSVRTPMTYQMIRLKSYTHLEQFLNDLLTLSNNIQKYSADNHVLERNEMLKLKTSGLIRKVAPSTLHYWMSIMMKPLSPLHKTVKRIIKPKQAESDSEDDNQDSKKIKLEY